MLVLILNSDYADAVLDLTQLDIKITEDKAPLTCFARPSGNTFGLSDCVGKG